MRIIAIVAASDNNVIGINNDMPWHLPNDFKFFKSITSGFPIIMGKNTWYSIGRPLPNRSNIIVSASMPEAPEGTFLVNTIEEALAYCRYQHASQAFIIGGGAIYHSTQGLWDELYLTRVHTTIPNGEVFFPSIDTNEWQQVGATPYAKDAKHNFDFTIEHWVRK